MAQLRTSCRHSEGFFENFNFKFSKNFKIQKFFPKLIDFKLTFKKIQKLIENASQSIFVPCVSFEKKFLSGAEMEPEPPNFALAPHPCFLSMV